MLLALGQQEAALQRLEQAAEDRDSWLIFVGVDEGLAELRDSPRFEAVAQSVLARR